MHTHMGSGREKETVSRELQRHREQTHTEIIQIYKDNLETIVCLITESVNI